jgi:hypothetical protein
VVQIHTYIHYVFTASTGSLSISNISQVTIKALVVGGGGSGGGGSGGGGNIGAYACGGGGDVYGGGIADGDGEYRNRDCGG